MAIYVAHIKRMPTAEYIGRYNPAVGKESPLHNPYKLQKGDGRGATLERYSAHLDKKVSERDPAVMAELRRLMAIARKRDLYLGCWCTPNPCHGDVVRAKLIEMMEAEKMTKRVAIIGSRELDDKSLERLTKIAEEFVRAGWEVSTGCADGADYAAMVGARNVDPTKLNIYLPWDTYNKEYHRDTDNTVVYDAKKHKDWTESVHDYHPASTGMKQGAFKLHARNYGIVHDCELVIANPVKIGQRSGTDQGIRVAKGLSIPCYVICDDKEMRKLREFMDAELSVPKCDFNITIAGTQKFHDYELFAEKCNNILGKLTATRNIIIHAKCGEHIEAMCERLADEHGYGLRKTKHTKPSGLIAFHDGKSKIIQKQIDIAQEQGIQIRTIMYDKYESTVCP